MFASELVVDAVVVEVRARLYHLLASAYVKTRFLSGVPSPIPACTALPGQVVPKKRNTYCKFHDSWIHGTKWFESKDDDEHRSFY